MKILILTADANTLVYHRGDLIRDFAARGHEVITAAAEDYPHVQKFVRNLGGRHRAIRMARSTVSLARDRETIVDMWRLFREEKPDVLFAYTIKSVCYGCVLARLAGVRKIHALLPGLGFTFVKQETFKGRLVARLSQWLHKFALSRVDAIFLQNPDDEILLRKLKVLPLRVPVHITAGSGVNVDEFPRDDLRAHMAPLAGRVKFVMVSRLLRSKGATIFAEAARLVKQTHPKAEFHLVGPLDPGPDGVKGKEVRTWTDAGLLTHHGMVYDVAGLLRAMHVFVLPTWYREGVPHATLEALSVGRPIITTDSTGARETVRLTTRGRSQRAAGDSVMEGTNGFLVHPRDPASLASAMRHLLDHPETIPTLGDESRAIAEEVFDVRKVNASILRAMGLTAGSAPSLQPMLSTANA